MKDILSNSIEMVSSRRSYKQGWRYLLSSIIGTWLPGRRACESASYTNLTKESRCSSVISQSYCLIPKVKFS